MQRPSTLVLERRQRWRHQKVDAVQSHWFFIYSESHSLKAGVLLNYVNLNVLLKMKTKWDVLSPKQSCSFCHTSGSTPTTRSWVGARKTVLLKTQNETESPLRTQGHSGIPHSSWRIPHFCRARGTVAPVSEVHLTEWRLRRAPCQWQPKWLHASFIT